MAATDSKFTEVEDQRLAREAILRISDPEIDPSSDKSYVSTIAEIFAGNGFLVPYNRRNVISLLAASSPNIEYLEDNGGQMTSLLDRVLPCGNTLHSLKTLCTSDRNSSMCTPSEDSCISPAFEPFRHLWKSHCHFTLNG